MKIFLKVFSSYADSLSYFLFFPGIVIHYYVQADTNYKEFRGGSFLYVSYSQN